MRQQCRAEAEQSNKGKRKEGKRLCLDEVIKLEPKVIFALGRLQPGCRLMTCSHNCGGVSSQAIYEFIKEQYSDLDGDIESQVQTAIQSCVRSGIVCALYDGKYRLIGPNPRAMVSHCTSRLTHGPRCCCLTLIKCMSKSMATSCCAFQWDFSPLKTKCNKQIQTVAVKESKDLDKTEEGKSWCKENTKKRKCDQDEKKNNSDNECRNSKKSKKDSSCQSDKKKSNEEDKKSKKLKRDASCQPDKDRPGSSYNRRIQNLKKRLMNRRSFSPARVECIPEGEERKICTSCGKLDVIYYPTTSNFASNDD